MKERARWRRAQRVFHAALRAEAGRRADLVERLSRGDPALRREVLGLLEAHRAAPSFLAEPLFRLFEGGDPDAAPELPERIGPYRVVSEIGRGGMGTVFSAERADAVFDKRVAIKVLRRGLGRPARQRFALERQALADLEHPNVARIYDGGTLADGRPYLVMELVEGLPIDRYCDRERLDVPARVRLFLAACEAAAAAHRRLLVHGDIKPGNVLVTQQGVPKLIDFGIAGRLHDARPSLHMTAAYAGPERSSGAPLTVADDVYSLGVVLFELLTGHRPRTVAPAELGAALGGDLAAILGRALAREPAARYDSVQAFAADLERFLADLPVAARRHSLPYLANKASRRSPLVAGLTAAAPLAVAVATLVRRRSAARVRRRARAAHHLAARGRELLAQRRIGAMLPRSESARHRSLLEAKVAALREEIGSGGRAGSGAGRYALACGLATLDRYGEARLCLEAALAEGFDLPEVSMLLGRTLWALYLEERKRAHRLASATELEGRLEELRLRYREPALEHLRIAARAGSEELSYVQGLIAFTDGELDRAAELAAEAFRQAPWLYEARHLEAEVAVARAREAADRGDLESAERHLGAAGDAYAFALAIGKSDAPLWAGEGARRAELFELHGRGLARPPLTVDDAIAPSTVATELTPGLLAPYLTRAAVFWRCSDLHERWDRDPMEWVDRTVAEAEAVLRIDPDHEEARILLAKAATVAIRWHTGRGADPSRWYELGRSAARRAIEIRPTSASARNIAGNLVFAWARSVHRSGSAPHRYLHEAVAHYLRAAELEAASSKYRANMALAFAFAAKVEAVRGRDPAAWVARAAEAARRALEENPREVIALVARAVAYGAASTFHVLSGASSPAAADRLDRYELAIGDVARVSDETAAWAAIELAENRRLRALRALALGRDPSSFIEEGILAARRGGEGLPNQMLAPLNLGQLLLVEARHRLLGGRSPEPAVLRALRAFDEGRDKQDADEWLPVGRAQAWWLLALWQVRSGGDPGDALRRARAELLDVPEDHYHRPRAAALQGALLLAEAEAEGAYPEAETEAEALLAWAREQNPLVLTEMLGTLVPQAI